MYLYVYNVRVVVRGQLCGVSSLILLLCGSPGPKSACQALGQVCLLTEPSCQSFVDFFYNGKTKGIIVLT